MTHRSPVYTDHAATARPLLFPIVEDEGWGNPAASHRQGKRARDALWEARTVASVALRAAPEQIMFTSGGTESNNWVITAQGWDFVITSPLEHHAVLHTVQRLKIPVSYLEPDGTGRICPMALGRLLRERHPTGRGLVTLALINNEVGSILDLESTQRIVREANTLRAADQRVYLHSDAVQAPGHVPIGRPRFF